jgi:hypothetical protein
MSDQLETVRCLVIRETAAAFLLQDREELSRQAFFPKSQISFQRRNIKTGEATAEIPLWLLTEKGWNQ